MYWGNSGFELGGFWGRLNNRGKDYVFANVDVCGYWVWISKGASKTPMRRQKKSPNCADDAPVRGARARAPHVREHHQHNWSLAAVFYQQKTVKSNAKCIIHMI